MDKEYFLRKGAGLGEHPLHSEVSLYREFFLEGREKAVEFIKPEGRAILEAGGVGEGELSIQFALEKAAQVIALPKAISTAVLIRFYARRQG